MFRKISRYIEEYFNSNDNKILCIDGARQIGKTYIIKETASKYFHNYIEINMADDYNDRQIFKNVKSVDSFYLQLGIIAGNKLGAINDTIVFIDEIQVYPHLFTLLKPLSIDNKYRYICSGSQLGIAIQRTTLIPMGYIKKIRMFPMDFEEFLLANNVSLEVIDYMKQCYHKEIAVEENVHELILDLFKKYLFVGGLPAAVNEYIKSKNIYEIRKIQSEISEYYAADAAKYDFENRLKIRLIYDLLASNMENKVKRLMLTKIENNEHARYKKYQDEFDYLVSSGISIGVTAISNPKFPLIESTSKNLIKLYYNDVGILTNVLYKTNINAILMNEKAVNLGSVYETVAAQELLAHGHDLHYFDRRKMGEVDFIIDDYDNLCVKPIEIKSGVDYLNYQALPKMVETSEYKIKNGYVFCNERDVTKKNNIITMPIYYIMFI